MPSPFDNFGVKLAVQKRGLISDGVGGWIESGWIDDPIFTGAVSIDNSMNVRIAEAERSVANITILTPLDIKLEKGSLVHNLENNSYYRIAGIPQTTPDYSGMNFSAYPAESTNKPN